MQNVQDSKTLRIKIVPNEDGFGPSMAVYYVARGLFAEAGRRGFDLHLTIQNERKAAFNRTLYSDWSQIGRAEIRSKHSIIELVKDGEKVRARETAELLLDYPARAASYCDDEDLLRCDAVISMGAPVALRAASGCNPYRTVVPSVEVFDHSWSVSLRKIIEADIQAHPDDWRDTKVSDLAGAEARFRKREWPQEWRDRKFVDVVVEIISEIENDESKADAVFLFPDFLAASEYYCHWQKVTTGKARRILGVFGGWADAEREKKRSEVRQRISERLGLAVDDQTKIALIQGGGTPIWDNFLVRMILECISLQSYFKNMLFLFSERQVKGAVEVAKRGATRTTKAVLEKIFDEIGRSTTVRLVTDDKQKGFPDFQELYVASNLVFSRPGGITVQDAIACRTPLVCAVEPGQWQTEKIRVNCELHGLLRTVPYEAFQAAGVGLVLDHIEHAENSRMRQIMCTVPNRQEQDDGGLASMIMAMIMNKSAQQTTSPRQG